MSHHNIRRERRLPNGNMRIYLEDQAFELSTDRCIYWLDESWLILSDLHLGKDESFRYHGIPIPGEVGERDLDRLEANIKKFNPKRVVVAGDFIHHNSSLSTHIIRNFAKRRKSWECEFIVVEGNHDRHVPEFPMVWNVHRVYGSLIKSNVRLIHDLGEQHDPWNGLTISGHLHPVVSVDLGLTQLILPCYYLQGSSLVLPAFTSFSTGAKVEPLDHERAYVATRRKVLERRDLGSVQPS
ncbi:ligase-associated DNA damage response endonuclease PdeM [Pseudobacteriovorax antillogorgiicola]|uniref:Putative phosphoesterase n=1 Tax=Pseudobacteriovorax antillogorgiicola TaxID=1513793 RepID=A0A1Y6C428_9BACT|nr:ligase-associated DNA damage response endonuclease PdeM [Pseudobacteriovorax antillogorgiicola]TCS49803.1 putative phosphoesterase [Pseudobacteriovorax antillogorgiicola]SMF43063.1 putative phosphoesterase [Pseudobacteriovorax antillogorgiicola]